MLPKWSLGGTIAAGFATLLTIMAVLVAFVVHEVNATQAQRRLLTNELLPAAHVAGRLEFDAVRFDDELQSFIATRAPDALNVVRLSRRSMRQAMRDLVRFHFSDQQDDYLAAQALAAAGNLQAQGPMAEQLAMGAPPERASSFARQYVKSNVADVVATTERLVQRLDAQVEATRAAIDLRQERLVRTLVLVFIWAGVFGTLIALLCLRVVTEPVGRLVMAARGLETGDYSPAHRLAAQALKGAPRNELAILARAFAHMAAALEEREQRLRLQATYLAASNARSTALQSLTDVALSEMPLDQLLEQLLQRVVSGTGGDRGGIYLKDPASGQLKLGASVNPAAGEQEAMLAAFEEEAAAQSEGAMLTSDAAPAAPGESGAKAWIAVRIQVGEERLGLARVEFHPARSVDSAAINLMRVFGERVAWAIERSRTLEKLEAWGHELERRLDQQRAQLLRSERLAAIGLVGGSIAHELRNPLGVINNAVYFLQHRGATLDDKMRRHLEIISREVQQSRRIIDGLVDYSDALEPESRRLSMNALIRTAIEESNLPERVTLELALDDNLPMVIGDESQLLQVFEHLIRNAVQAMEGEGVLRIANGANEGAVWTSVRDTGPGVAPEDQARIFEPLVSTRVKGMGLGLSLARKIIGAHGGAIQIVSEPGCGATFTVELPVTDRLRAPAAADQESLTSIG